MNGIYEEIRLALHGIWQRRWLALAVAWAIAGLGWLVIAFIPNSYESKARVFVEQQNVLSTQIGVTEREQRANLGRIRQTLASTSNLEQVVRQTDLANEATTDEQIRSLASSLRERITITAEQDPTRIGEPGNTFEITASWDSPAVAQQINQKLIDVFLETNLAGSRAEATQSVEFLDRQIAERETELQQLEERQARFESRLSGVLPGSGTIAQRLNQARVELRNVESDLAAAQSSLSSIQAQLSATPATVETPGTFVAGASGPAGARLSALEAQLADLRARGLRDAHPDVQALQRQIPAARAAASREGGGGGRRVGGGSSANPFYMSLRSMLADRQAQVAELTARRNQLRDALQGVNQRQSIDPSSLAEQQQIERDYQALQTQYNQLVADRERVRLRGDVAAETDSETFQVVNPPSMPTAPAAPNRPLLLVLVLMAAIGGGIGAAFAKSQLQTTYSTAQRLGNGTGLPVLGAISEVLRPDDFGLRRQQLRRFAGGVAALGGVFALLMAAEFVQRGLA